MVGLEAIVRMRKRLPELISLICAAFMLCALPLLHRNAFFDINRFKVEVVCRVVPVLALLIPGYALALLLMFFVPPIFTSIAFDSGGVASGPMTATFLLPFAIGACTALGGDVVADAFGVVAMVAMTPLITIQILGVYYRFKQRGARPGTANEAEPVEDIIDL